LQHEVDLGVCGGAKILRWGDWRNVCTGAGNGEARALIWGRRIWGERRGPTVAGEARAQGCAGEARAQGCAPERSAGEARAQGCSPPSGDGGLAEGWGKRIRSEDKVEREWMCLVDILEQNLEPQRGSFPGQNFLCRGLEARPSVKKPFAEGQVRPSAKNFLAQFFCGAIIHCFELNFKIWVNFGFFYMFL